MLGTLTIVRLLPLTASVFSLAAFAESQVIGGEWVQALSFDGQVPAGRFGYSLTAVSDFSGDGVGDVAIGEPGSSATTIAGTLWIHCAVSGQVLGQVTGSSIGQQFGSDAADVGDADGDGIDDILVGAPISIGATRSAAYLVSGASLQVVSTYSAISSTQQAGIAVTGAGDLDLDGFADLVIGVPELALVPGEVWVYAGGLSGGQPRLLYGLLGAYPNDRFGFAVDGGSDVDGDGIGDILVGDPFADPGITDLGLVSVFSGATGVALGSIATTATGFVGDRQGHSVAFGGDMNGDGLSEIIVGAPFARSIGGVPTGSVRVYDGASFVELYYLEGSSPSQRFGWDVSRIDDVDGDAVVDFAVGAPETPPGGSALKSGALYLYSGATGALIAEFTDFAQYDHWGISIASLGDTDADGRPEFLAGADRHTAPVGQFNSGTAGVFGLDGFLTTSAANLSISAGTPLDLYIDFPASEAGKPYAVLGSAAGTGPTIIGQVAIPLSSDSLFNRMIGGWGPPPLRGGHGILDSDGVATAQVLPLPLLSAHIGKVFFVAAVSYESGTRAPRLSSVAESIEVVP